MSGFECSRSAAGLCVGLGSLSPVAAEAEAHAELTCLLGSPLSLPSERLVSARSGHENRVRVELGRREPGWLAGVDSSAALRLELGLDGLGSGAPPPLRDSGSWLRLDWRGLSKWQFSVRAFPFDTDYERLGYLHALDWGGTDSSRGESIFLGQRGGVPGLELGLKGSGAELWAGLRWAKSSEGLAGTEQQLWGGLLRGSLSLQRSLRADFGLGYFQRPALGLATDGRLTFVQGASLRLVWRSGLREPELAAEPFRSPSFRDSTLWLEAPTDRGAALALEGVALVSELRRFEAPAQVALGVAPAAALYASARGEVLEGHAGLAWRSLSFVQRNQPGLMRGETLPLDTNARAELSAWVGASATSARLHLTPSLELGVLVPAALEAPSALSGFGQTFVVHETGEVQALPVGSGRLPIVAGRAALRFRVSSTTALAAFVDYERDPNRVRFETSPLGARRGFASPDRRGLGAALQARF